ncbi:uncharacterized protein [Ambystoma mexicanum]|uniref:uncharacterized protein n=1 Tax=Ambystoma mexicanum TaxID=8296 RepID=UPI0037E7054A
MPIKSSSGSDTESSFLSRSETAETEGLSKSKLQRKDSSFASKDKTSFSNTDSDTCLHCTSGPRKTKDLSAWKKRSQRRKSDSNRTDIKNKIHRDSDHRQHNHKKEQSASQEIQISNNRCTQKEISQSCGLCKRNPIENVSTPTAPSTHSKLVDRKLEKVSDSSVERSEADSTIFSSPTFPQKGKKSQQLSNTHIPKPTSINYSQTLPNKQLRNNVRTYGISKQEHLDRRTSQSMLSKKYGNTNLNCQSLIPSHNSLQNSSPRQLENCSLDSPECLNTHKDHQFKNCNCSDENSSIVITLTLDTGKSDDSEKQSKCGTPLINHSTLSSAWKSKTEDLVSLSKSHVRTDFDEPHSGQHLRKCANSTSAKHQTLSTRQPKNKNVSSPVKSGCTQLQSIFAPLNYCYKSSDCSSNENCNSKNKLLYWQSFNSGYGQNSCNRRKLNPQCSHFAAQQDIVPLETELPHSSKETLSTALFQPNQTEMDKLFEQDTDDQCSVCDLCYKGHETKFSQLAEVENNSQALHECQKKSKCAASEELLDSQDYDHDFFCKCGRVPQHGLFPNGPIAQAVSSQPKKDSCLARKSDDYHHEPTNLCRHKFTDQKNELTAAAQKVVKANKCPNVSNRFPSEEHMCKFMKERELFNKTQSFFESGSRKNIVHQRNEIDWIKKESLTEEENVASACPLITKQDGETAVGNYFGIKLKDHNSGPKEEGHNLSKEKEFERQSCCGVHLANCQGTCSHNLEPIEESWHEKRGCENRTCLDRIQEMPKSDDEQSCAFCENFYKFGQANELH